MKSFVSFAVLLAITAAPIGLKAADNSPPPGFVALFNGKDFANWRVPPGDNGHWNIVDGVIDYDAESQAPGEAKGHRRVRRCQERGKQKQTEQQEERQSQGNSELPQAGLPPTRQQPRCQGRYRQDFQVGEVLAGQHYQWLNPLERSAHDQGQKSEKSPVDSTRE